MTRREFFAASAALAPSGATSIMTVRGPVTPWTNGVFLPHEHLFSAFGEEPREKAQYDEKALLASVVPAVEKIRQAGCAAIADCTTAYFGRHVALLKLISERAGVHILANTGYYGAAGDRYVPKHAYAETADQIARRWIAEWMEGIDGTGVRPGFIKLGVDPGPLTDIDRKLITAGARAHLETGLLITVHTGDSPAGVRDQLAVLKSEGVAPAAWSWVHANAVKDMAVLEEASAGGAWISLDGLASDTLDRHLELVRWMRQRGRHGQVLLSHDGNGFRIDKPGKAFTALFTDFVPLLSKSGLSAEEVLQVTVENPLRAFAVGVRRV
jgi:phosphotriesterase-related protein